MDKTVKKQVTEEIERIECQNLSEKREELVEEIQCCKDCMYHQELWLRGGRLYCCGYDYDNPRTSREKEVFYNDCPIDHKLTYHRNYIKQYGIIHEKPEEHSYRSRRGSISVVDFSRTTFEWDGYNSDVDWQDIVVFYYKTEEECEQMMELALDYYHKFNLDAPYVEKRCYG